MDAIVPEAPEPLATEEPVVAPTDSPAPLPMSWRRPAMALAVAAGLTAGVFFLADRLDSRSRPADPSPAAIAGTQAAAISSPEPPSLAAAPTADTPGRVEPVSNRQASAARPAKKIHPELKQPAEDLQLKAALARIDADRQDAREKASDLFGDAEKSEKDGARFLRERDYDAAQMAFSRAAQLFARAQEVSFQERVRDTSLSANP